MHKYKKNRKCKDTTCTFEYNICFFYETFFKVHNGLTHQLSPRAMIRSSMLRACPGETRRIKYYTDKFYGTLHSRNILWVYILSKTITFTVQLTFIR